MKLGISYNVFDDAAELLRGSIMQIRESVEHVSVVYQLVSNHGNAATEPLKETLEGLVSEGLVNEIIEYKPNLKQSAAFNEINKRNLGLYLAKVAGCTHFLSMDSDEYYIKSEFNRAKQLVVEGNFDASACQMLTFFKEWGYMLSPPEDYFVPFIYQIDNREFILGAQFPVVVDPTRRMTPKNILLFKREDLQMYHGSHIRKNWKNKIVNSSALINYKQEVNKLVKEYDAWAYGKKAYLPGNPCRFHNVVKTEVAKNFINA